MFHGPHPLHVLIYMDRFTVEKLKSLLYTEDKAILAIRAVLRNAFGDDFGHRPPGQNQCGP